VLNKVAFLAFSAATGACRTYRSTINTNGLKTLPVLKSVHLRLPRSIESIPDVLDNEASIMFEHFTFGAQVQPRFPEYEEETACPRDISHTALAVQRPDSVPTTLDESPMNDLLCKLTHQSLEAEDSDMPIRWTDNLVCSAAEKSYRENHELSYISSRRGRTILRAAPSMKHISRPCRRHLRQLNTQLQSCTDHVKDIETLVEDMISTNSQCQVSTASGTTVTTPLSPPLSPPQSYFPPNDLIPSPVQHLPQIEAADEGFSELDETEALEMLVRERHVSLSKYSRHNSSAVSSDHGNTALSESASRTFGVMRHGSYRSYSYSNAGEQAPVDDINNYMPREPGRGMVLSKPRMRLRREDEEKRRQRRKERKRREQKAAGIALDNESLMAE